MPTLTLKTNGNSLLCTPVCTERSAGEGELLLGAIHDDPMLPDESRGNKGKPLQFSTNAGYIQKT